MKTFFSATTLLMGSATSLLAADLPARVPAVAPAPTFVAMNWTGFYVGVHGGYGWGALTSGNDNTIDHKPKGGLFGGQIGYNWQINKIVLGVEADLTYSTIKGSDTTTYLQFTINGSHDKKSFGTVRGRLGFAHDQFLFYATGGFAYSQVVGRLDVIGVISGTDTLNLKGWTVGGGVEMALTPNLSARLEYLYIDYQKATTRMNLGFPFSDSVDKNTNVVRVGLNYRFGGSSAPVVAKY